LTQLFRTTDKFGHGRIRPLRRAGQRKFQVRRDPEFFQPPENGFHRASFIAEEDTSPDADELPAEPLKDGLAIHVFLEFFRPVVAFAVGLFAHTGLVHGDLRLWIVRLATTGLAFLVLAFLVGRISEGIIPGLGGAALVAFALGTYVAPLAATSFDHVAAGAFAFGGFVLAWSRRYILAGLSAAIAVDTNYLCAVIGVIVGGYVLVAGIRPLLRFAAGAAGPLLLLGAYDWAAFGSPFHLSYRYVANKYASSQQAGFFGIHLPSAHGIGQVLLGDRGILVASPVLVAAVAGTILLMRRYRPEAIVCLAVFGALVLLNAGYFLIQCKSEDDRESVYRMCGRYSREDADGGARRPGPRG